MPFDETAREMVTSGVNEDTPCEKMKLFFQYAADSGCDSVDPWIVVTDACHSHPDFIAFVNTLTVEKYRDYTGDLYKKALATICTFHRTYASDPARIRDGYKAVPYGPHSKRQWIVNAFIPSVALQMITRFHPKLLIWDVAQLDLLRAMAYTISLEGKAPRTVEHIIVSVNTHEIDSVAEALQPGSEIMQPLSELRTYGEPIVIKWSDVLAEYNNVAAAVANERAAAVAAAMAGIAPAPAAQQVVVPPTAPAAVPLAAQQGMDDKDDDDNEKETEMAASATQSMSAPFGANAQLSTGTQGFFAAFGKKTSPRVKGSPSELTSPPSVAHSNSTVTMSPSRPKNLLKGMSMKKTPVKSKLDIPSALRSNATPSPSKKKVSFAPHWHFSSDDDDEQKEDEPDE